MIVNLRFGPNGIKQAEHALLPGQFVDLAGRIVQIAERNGAGGTGLDASRSVGDRPGLVVGYRKLFRFMPAAVAEVALLNDSAHAGCDRRVQSLLHAGRPRRIGPVEVAGVIRASRHTVPAAQAALRNLADDAGGRVEFHGVLRADRDAGCLFLALLAHHWNERRAAGVLVAHHTHGRDAGAFVRGGRGGRYVVLHGAGDHAGAAAGAAVDVDQHAVARILRLAVVRDHARTTFFASARNAPSLVSQSANQAWPAAI